MNTIRSSNLHRLATAPQALDDQCFPDVALAMMYEDDPYPETTAAANLLRSVAVRREWHRSLLYSPQVILNRAFAVNEPVIFEELAKHPEAYAYLFSTGRLVIHLLNTSMRKSTGTVRAEESMEDFLNDPPPFDVNPHGKKAWLEYLAAGNPIRYLRLDTDEDQVVAGRFPTTIGSLGNKMLQRDKAQLLLRGLRGQHTDTHQGGDAELAGDLGLDWAEFGDFCEKIVDPWVKSTIRAKGEVGVSRGAIYRQFVLPEGAPSNLKAIDPNKPYSMEMKLFADLVYNNNVPTTVGAFSFIPSGLPDPRCIPPELRGLRKAGRQLNEAASIELVGRVAEATKRGQIEDEFVYGTQPELILYDWASMSVADIVELIASPNSGLAEMSIAMDRVMDFADPEDFRRRLTDVARTVEGFQSHLHGQATAKNWTRLTSESLKLVVRPALVIGGQMIKAGISGAMISAVSTRAADVAIDSVVDFLGKRKSKRFERDRRASLSSAVASIADAASALNAITPGYGAATVPTASVGSPARDDQSQRNDDTNRRC